MPVQGQNNYNAYANPGVVNSRVNNWAPGINNWNQGIGTNYVANDGKIYVNGRAGADAFPLQYGMNSAVLWDTESKRFFVKGYDNNGIPRVLEDNDYTPHVEPETAHQEMTDLSVYATKEDIQNMIASALSNVQSPKMSGYVTKKDFEKALSELTVGAGGRVVRENDAAR